MAVEPSIAPIRPEQRTFTHLLQREAESARELLAIGSESWTVAHMRETVGQFAGLLAAAGVHTGDRVAILCSNRPEFMQAFFGCLWMGAVAVPINVASRGLQLQHILSNCGARLLIVEGNLAPALDTIELDRLAVETIWFVGEPDAAHRRKGAPMPPPGAFAPAAAVKPSDMACIIYTSGTTGPSKGVCCSHAHLVSWGENTAAQLGLVRGDRLFTTLPLFHINALNTVFQALVAGATMIVEDRFSVSRFWTALAAGGGTVTYLLGAMVPMLLSRPPSEGDRGHKARIALAPGVPVQFQEAFRERFGIELMEGFGSTETNFVIGPPPGGPRPGTMGKVRPGFSARVVDEEDNEVRRGEPGELILRADEPFAFASGYFGMPEKTVEAWRNLWFHTGDRVVQDEDGYFRFVDRLKDAIRRRGENISSYEVEQAICSHPEVAAAAVFPVRSELAEDEVMAAIVLRPGATLSQADLIAFCKPKLSYFAIPRFIDFVTELPMTENGKPQKFKLRERGVTEATWDREAHGISAR